MTEPRILSGPVTCSGDPNSPFRMDPDRLEQVPPDFKGPCMIELVYRHRSGRGRWYRQNEAGYTDVFVYAGVYSAAEAHAICDGRDECYPVNFLAALEAADNELSEMYSRAVSS